MTDQEDDLPYQFSSTNLRYMDMIDYFAAMALQGLIAGRYIEGKNFGVICTTAYEFGVVMAKTRKEFKEKLKDG